ncbi:phosphatidylglycerophosphatase A [Neptunomonas sp.]|uniref:phosphatidylglycerophosphatase A family protein n=1 Tax=Neptunomonas TaxID=75687 RepID=UPI003513425D
MQPTPRSVFTHPAQFLAFGLGSGLSPKAPGTVGTLAAIPFYLALSLLDTQAYIATVFVAAIIGIFLCGEAARELKVHDHPGIVWDEFVGFWITMIAVPVTGLNILLGFALFRLFDIWKPWPISWCDKHVHGGLGIMLDDVLAGVLALACLHLCVAWIG